MGIVMTPGPDEVWTLSHCIFSRTIDNTTCLTPGALCTSARKQAQMSDSALSCSLKKWYLMPTALVRETPLWECTGMHASTSRRNCRVSMGLHQSYPFFIYVPRYTWACKMHHNFQYYYIIHCEMPNTYSDIILYQYVIPCSHRVSKIHRHFKVLTETIIYLRFIAIL